MAEFLHLDYVLAFFATDYEMILQILLDSNDEKLSKYLMGRRLITCWKDIILLFNFNLKQR